MTAQAISVYERDDPQRAHQTSIPRPLRRRILTPYSLKQTLHEALHNFPFPRGARAFVYENLSRHPCVMHMSPVKGLQNLSCR